MDFKSIIFAVACVAAGMASMGCGGTVSLGGQKLSYAELCDENTRRCAGTGHPSIWMADSRPQYEGDPKQYLGKLVMLRDVTQLRKACFTPKDEDIIKSPFTHTFELTTVKESDIKAAISAAAKATLAGGMVDDAPGLTATLTASVSSTLRQKNYAKGAYTVYTLNNAALERLQNPAPNSPEAQCREAVKNSPTHAFVRSFSIITVQTVMNSDAKEAIAAAVDASVSNFKYNNGAFAATLSTSLSAAIAYNVEKTVSGVTAKHDEVYSYAFWTELRDPAEAIRVATNLAASVELVTHNAAVMP
jgi:hypothetical protein